MQGPFFITIPGNNDNGGALPWTNTGMKVPLWTSYLVTVSGSVTVTAKPNACGAKPPFGSEGSYGPAGDRFYQLRVVPGMRVGTGAPSNLWLNYAGTESRTDTLFAWDAAEVAVYRTGIAGNIGMDGCQSGFYQLSSGQTISLYTFEGQELQLTPSVAVVRRGTRVTFTASSRGVVFSGPNWRFLPAEGVINETVACGTAGPNPCVVNVLNSGTLRVSVHIHGQMRGAAATVRVYSTFALQADPAQVITGDTVSFTPILDGTPGPAIRWRWQGDDGTAAANPCLAIVNDKCRYVPASSGTMWAYTAATGGDSASAHVTVIPPKLTLTASKTTLVAGDSATFTATGNGTTLAVQGWAFRPDSVTGGSATVGSSWGTCVPGSTQCTEVVLSSGTVSVIGTVNGVSSSDSVHLTVTSPPGDCDAGLSRSASSAGGLTPTASRSRSGLAVPQAASLNCVPDPNPSGPDSLLIYCHPTGVSAGIVTRHDSVSCNAKLRSGKRFTLSATGTANGAAEGTGQWQISFTPRSDSTFYSSVGTAAITTTITGTATRIEDSATLSSISTFIVNPRASSVIALTRPWSKLDGPVLSTSADSGEYLTFGKYPVTLFDATAPLPPVLVVRAGPDSGLVLITVLPDTAPGGFALINAALHGVGDWASDQADLTSHSDTAPVPYYNTRWCRPADFPHLIDITKAHEGSANNDGLPPLAGHPDRPGTSHYDIRRRVVAEHLAPRLESLVFREPRTSFGAEVWGRINTVFSDVQSDIAFPLDYQFDDSENLMPVLYSNARFGCQDYLPWKGGNP